MGIVTVSGHRGVKVISRSFLNALIFPLSCVVHQEDVGEAVIVEEEELTRTVILLMDDHLVAGR
jgi:hypothetical protein